MRKLTLSLAVIAALLPARGYPLGLGELELKSALNQELSAEIEVLSATPEDADQLIVKLADREAFSRAGIDRPYLLQQLKFKVVNKNGQPYVKVFTKTPVREPFLSFLLEIDWPQGHLLREYTLLLDPPVYNTRPAGAPASPESAHPFIEPSDAGAQAQPVSPGQTSAQSVQSGYQAAPATQNLQSGVITSDSGRSVRYQYQPLPQATTPSGGQYRVQKNDTLWSMASRMRPDSSVSVEQMMLALVRENPEAFIQQNINGVKRGYILRIPDRDVATQLSRQEAIAEARDHAALWREYSQGAVSASPASAMEADETIGRSAADQPRDADGHLSIVGASEDEGSEFAGTNQDPQSELARLRQDLAMAREQLESEKLEKEDLRTRLADLEQRVQRVIEMDDGELAKLQQELQQTQALAEPAEAVEETVESAAQEMAEEAPVEEAVIEEELLSEEVVEEAPVEEGLESAETAGETTEEEALFVDEAESADEAIDEMAETAPQVEPVKAIEPPAFVQTEPKGFVGSLLDDPKLLGIIGGGLAFLFLLIALILKRLRGGQSEEDEWNAALDSDIATSPDATEPALDLNDPTVQTEAVEDLMSTAEMMAEPVDGDLGLDEDITRVKVPETASDDLEDTVFDLDGGGDKPAEEAAQQDDVLAEADVYLAYGIYQQAEELLNNAIDKNPDRDDYRLKLLETHFAAKNASGFEQLAKDVQARKGSDKSYWDRVTAMGMELCPGSSLFSGASMADFDADALLPDTSHASDLELDVGEEQTADSGEVDAFDESLTLSEPIDAAMLQEASEPMDDLGLDEDLDLAGDLESITNDIEEAVEETPIAEDTSSDLEFDLGEIEDDMGGVEEVAEESAEEVVSDLDIDDDFSLDFAASDLGFEESEDEAETAADEMSLDADLDLGIDLEDDIGGMEDVAEEEPEMDLSSELGDIDIGGDDLDLGDMDLDEAITDDVASLDLDAGLDLDEGTEEEVSLDLSADDAEFDISELSEDVDEVSTKLDLARAYIDMGDNDGARSILEEVKTEGNNEQQQQAEELLQQAS